VNVPNEIRRLNDRARNTFTGCRVFITPGVQQLNEIEMVLHKVQSFDQFAEANDPHDEHDFGSVEAEGQTIFWKIDYYDHSLTQGSQDPSNPEVTIRVLTIMLASEY